MLSTMVIAKPLSRVTSTIGSDMSGAILSGANLMPISLFGSQVPFLTVHFLANLGAFSETLESIAS